MSKPGIHNPQAKQENNPFKKDNRTFNNANNANVKEEKRTSFGAPANQVHNQGHGRGGGGGQGGGRNQQRNQQHGGNQAHNRDRSGNRNDNKQFDNTDRNSANDNKNDEKMEEETTATTQPQTEKKFTGRCRLFVGNLPQDVSEDDFKKMFESYGEFSEVYVNTSRGFGFIRLDYRHNAEAAKAALDGLQKKGRVLRVRFATHGAALRVKNLHQYVSNELLEQSFSQFGDLERCIVIVDDRGKPTGEGIVEFMRKPGATSALRRINEGVFLLGADPKPVTVEPLEQKDEEDGLPEKFLMKTEGYKKEREKDPRFAPPGTFDYEFGMRWKQLEELEKQRIEQIKKDTEEARLKLEDEMQNALYEYQAEQIRQDLLRQQEELRRLEDLRNTDRMRRRQQDDRDRSIQEERRRADMMLSMRQQELATGRRMDDRRREEMMMNERYGDRGMPERGMPERMQERMQGPDRMGERMQGPGPDRMGERMPPERMGPGPDRGQGGPPSQYMWDEKQRNEREREVREREAAMRGEGGPGGRGGGRGDMRGAAPLQPPPQPPAGMGSGERGGLNPANAGAAGGQGAKGSPKPLMQGGGFGGPGGAGGNPPQQGGGEGPGNQMRRSRFDQGPPGPGGAEGAFQNQRGVLGAPPGGMGGPPGAGALGAAAAAAAALAASQLRGGAGMGAGGGSPNMFQGGNPQASLNERLLLERRREAAREELSDIKRMRRF